MTKAVHFLRWTTHGSYPIDSGTVHRQALGAPGDSAADGDGVGYCGSRICPRRGQSSRFSLIFAIGVLLLAAHASRVVAATPGQFIACRMRTLPLEERVGRLAVHPESGTVDYLFMGEIGRAGGRRVVDWVTGTVKFESRLPAAHPAELLVSPSGRLLAQEKVVPGKSTLVVSGIDGGGSRTCVASEAFHRPLEFSSDEEFLLATSVLGDEHQLLVCNAQGGLVRAWLATTVAERAREALQFRYHGRPPWMIDFALFSPDAKRILSGRGDGQIVLWNADGRRLDSTMVPGFSPGSMRARFGFDRDGTAYRITEGAGERSGRAYFIVSSLFPEVPKFEIIRDAPVRSAAVLETTQFHTTTRGLVLLHVKSSSIAIVSVPGDELLAEVPASEPVTALAMSSDGAVVAVAHPGSINLWRLESTGSCRMDVDPAAPPAR